MIGVESMWLTKMMFKCEAEQLNSTNWWPDLKFCFVQYYFNFVVEKFVEFTTEEDDWGINLAENEKYRRAESD